MKNTERQRTLLEFLDIESDESKTVDYITKNSFESVHRTLRSITGESAENFITRFKIIHAIATRAIKPRLKLEDISLLLELERDKISGHLQPLREGGILDNKGGQFWRLTPYGRRLVDSLTILLFEHNDDFDEIDMLRASLTHLSELAKEYDLELNVEARIIRFFDDILSELEDLAIDLLDPLSAKRSWNLLRKSESFYNHLRSISYKKSKIASRDMWLLLDRLAKRHQVVGQLVALLDKRIAKLSENIELEDALGLYLEFITPKKTYEMFSHFFSFNNIYTTSRVNSKELVVKASSFLVKKPITPLPDFDTLEIYEPEELEYVNQEDKMYDIVLTEVQKLAKVKPFRVSDLINIKSWKDSSPILMLLARLSSEGKIELVDDFDEDFIESEISRLRNPRVRVNGNF